VQDFKLPFFGQGIITADSLCANLLPSCIQQKFH